MAGLAWHGRALRRHAQVRLQLLRVHGQWPQSLAMEPIAKEAGQRVPFALNCLESMVNAEYVGSARLAPNHPD